MATTPDPRIQQVEPLINIDGVAGRVVSLPRLRDSFESVYAKSRNNYEWTIVAIPTRETIATIAAGGGWSTFIGVRAGYADSTFALYNRILSTFPVLIPIAGVSLEAHGSDIYADIARAGAADVVDQAVTVAAIPGRPSLYNVFQEDNEIVGTFELTPLAIGWRFHVGDGVKPGDIIQAIHPNGVTILATYPAVADLAYRPINILAAAYRYTNSDGLAHSLVFDCLCRG